MGSRTRRMRLVWAAVLGIVLIGISVGAAMTGWLMGGKEKSIMSLVITSPSFMQDRAISSRHTCDGLNVSPPLSWTGVPAGTKSLALIVDDPDAPDPDAPRMTWVHWVLYNIPPDTNGLPESATIEILPPGTLQGMNDWKRPGYEGPCPPIGSHRYYHKLFALDVVLPDMELPTKAVLEKAMQSHILARSELIGRYQRR